MNDLIDTYLEPKNTTEVYTLVLLCSLVVAVFATIFSLQESTVLLLSLVSVAFAPLFLHFRKNKSASHKRMNNLVEPRGRDFLLYDRALHTSFDPSEIVRVVVHEGEREAAKLESERKAQAQVSVQTKGLSQADIEFITEEFTSADLEFFKTHILGRRAGVRNHFVKKPLIKRLQTPNGSTVTTKGINFGTVRSVDNLRVSVNYHVVMGNGRVEVRDNKKQSRFLRERANSQARLKKLDQS